MIIHVVKSGDTLSKIGQMYNVDYRKIATDNEIPLNQSLVIGQTIVVITNNNNKLRDIEVNGYAFPNIDKPLLTEILPSLTYLSIFSYHVDTNGNLSTVNDQELISMAKNYRVKPMMVVTNIGPEGRFSSELARTILNDEALQDKLINNIIGIMKNKGYSGLDIDFEYIYPSDKYKYINFLKKVKTAMKQNNYFLSVAVAPKTSDEQQGILYEAHDYKRIGEIADHVILMTYEWGYSGGPARAVAPINLVERVLAYAVTRIPPDKILLGIPNYGYDWTLPYVQGNLARSIGNYQAVDMARGYRQAINYSDQDQAPFFNYYDTSSARHEVWFEDARSIQAKLQLVLKYNIEGISYWTIDRFFPQNYLVLNAMFNIKK